METKFNFKSQVCTSIAQSEILLKLGLKKETADMVYRSYGYIMDEFGDKERRFKQPTIRDAEDYEGEYDIPAWSLHRLIQMIADTDLQVTHSVGVNIFDPFGKIIDCIEWLIKGGYFNEEYLV